MEKRTPVEKSIVRHKLKEIDKKWDSRKIRTKGASKIKTNYFKKSKTDDTDMDERRANDFARKMYPKN